MTIENLKQIAIKYATKKGSRVPLAPDELCNAVVQYFNEFLKITADINTIQVAVTEEGGNIVFTITGNTLDGKAFTPIVITVDHNDFVTDQEFEEFKTTTNAAIQKNTEIINSLSFRVEDTENDITTIQVQVGQINTRVGNTETNVTNLKNRVDNTETNIAKINSTLENKVDVIKNPVSNFVAYVHINQKDENISFTESAIGNTLVYRRASDGSFNVSKGTSGQNVANMENIADVEAKIPDVSEFANKNESNEWTDVNLFKPAPNGNSSLQVVDSSAIPLRIGKNGFYISTDSSLLFPNFIGQTLTIATTNNIPDVSNFLVKNNINIIDYNSFGIKDVNGNTIIAKCTTSEGLCVGSNSRATQINSSKRPSLSIANTNLEQMAFLSDIPEYTNVDSVTYDSTNGAIIAYDGANEIHIPLLAGENVTIDASEDNKKIVISAAGGGGTGDVTAAGNNTFTGENTFNNSIYAKNGVVVGDTTNYGANSVTKGSNTYSFPNKSGTFAMTTDVIKDPIYFISFYINASDETLRLAGTMMSKNSYGTGQKTNEEFAVLLADNLYINSNEGLAVYGKLVGSKEKDIICIYSDDGLAVRYMDETNGDFELPAAVFFVMETEL